MSAVSDESSITVEWLEGVLQTYFAYSADAEAEKHPENPPEATCAIHNPPAAKNTQVRVLDFQVKPGCEEGENLLSDLLAIDVTFRRLSTESDAAAQAEGTDEQLHLMAKLLSQDPFCRHFIIEAGFDVREIHFYTTLIPVLQKFLDKINPESGKTQWPIPHCYYAKYRQGSDSVLLLENLKESSYSMVDFSRGISLEETIAAVKSMAKIHACGLAFRLTEDVDLEEAFLFLFRPEAAAESYQQLLERGLPQLGSFLHKSDNQQLQAILSKLYKLRPRAREVITELLNPSSAISTVCHTDFWSNNLLFRQSESGVECKIIDWQMVTYSRPTNDIALLMVTSVNSEIRRQHTDAVLQAYWEELSSECSKLHLDIESRLGYHYSDLVAEYQRSLLLAVLLGIGSVDLAIGRTVTENRVCDILIDLNQENLFD